MEIHIKGSVKELADLIKLIEGRQAQEIRLGVEGNEIAKSVLEASRGTSEDKAN